MTKKEFFKNKLIPQLEEQIFEYEFQLVRNQYILQRLQKELEEMEKTPILEPTQNIEKILRERGKRKSELQEEIEKVKRNIEILPILKAEEEKFLEYFKKFVESL